MNTSLEISMYPIADEYKTPILDFINRLRSIEGLEVRSNGMSTQIFGDYDLLMSTVKKEMKTTFLAQDKVVMVMKLFNSDLREGPEFD